MQRKQGELIDQALGRLPLGSYLMTAGFDGQRSGMLVSSVQCCCQEPALICVAARKGHKIDPLIRDSRSFAIGVVSPEDKLVRRRFKRTDMAPAEHQLGGEDDPFDAIETRTLVTGAPILPRCTTWFDCEVMRRVDLEAEMELFVGLIVGLMHEGERAVIDRVNALNGSD